MAKQFTREWEIWKLTNEAAAGREDEEKIEREKKMAEARKERDRVRAEMIREEAAERVLWAGVGPGEATWDNGGGGNGYGEASPQWDGRNQSGSRAPWDEPARSEVGDSALWDQPIGGGGGSDGGVSPEWDGGVSTNNRNSSGRAPWDEPSSSAPRNDALDNPSGRSPSYEPPSSRVGQSYGGSSSKAPWDAPTGARAPSYEPLSSGRRGSPSRAPWDAPAGGRSPTYEPHSSGRSQPYQSAQQTSSSSIAPWDQPPKEPIVASWNQPIASSSRAPWDEPGPAAGNDSAGTLWDELTGDNDNSYTSVLCSPPSSPGRPPPSPLTVAWDTLTGGSGGDIAPTTSNDTAGKGRGRVAAHELHSFSALSAGCTLWDQDGGADSGPLYHDPNSEGEQAYLRRAAAAAGEGTGALCDTPTGRSEGGRAWEYGSGNNENNSNTESSEPPKSTGNEDAKAPWDDNDGSGNDVDNGDTSPPWSGGFGGSSPVADNSDSSAPWGGC